MHTHRKYCVVQGVSTARLRALVLSYLLCDCIFIRQNEGAML